jgi:TRAP-type C4-dicarboxylate transport system substrate-binding protein
MKKRHWVLMALVLVLLASLLITSCGEETTTAPPPTSTQATTATTQEPTGGGTIKISYSCPPGKGYSQGEEWFGPEFEKRTNGRYKVEVYGMSTLVPIDAVLDSVRSGVCQIGLTSTAQFAKDFPLSMVTQIMTLGFPMTAVYHDWYDAAVPAWNEFAEIPEVKAELNNGFTYSWNDLLGASMLVMKNKEVRVPSDFAGTKIGTVGGFADVVKANGGATVAIVVPEMYMNLDKGVIDGAPMSATMCTDWKMHTICDWYYGVDLGTGAMLVLYNNDFYNSLPPEDKKIFDDTRAEAWPICRDFMLEADMKSQKILEDAGIEITMPTAEENAAWKQTVQEVIVPAWRADAKSVGVSDAVLDKVYNAWLEIRAKYWKQYNLPGEP